MMNVLLVLPGIIACFFALLAVLIIKSYIQPKIDVLGDYDESLDRSRTIAKPYTVLKNGKRLVQKTWIDGSIIISLNHSYDTDRIMSLPSYTRFMEASQNNAITLFA